MKFLLTKELITRVYRSLDIQILFEIFLRKPRYQNKMKLRNTSMNDFSSEKKGVLNRTRANCVEFIRTRENVVFSLQWQDSIYNGTPIALAAPLWHRLPPRIVFRATSNLFEIAIKKVKLRHKRKRAYLRYSWYELL